MSHIATSVELALLVLTVLVLVGPLLAERIRIPGLIGLILLGTVFGPYVLNALRPAGLVATFGAIGLLYLMFLAGIELDIKSFMENRAAAITFGLLTFAIPFAASLAVGFLYLDYELAGAALIGAMWASHTLVAYPEVKAAGLSASRAVGSAVSATVITDVLSLLILGVAVSSAGAEAAAESAPLPVWLGIVVLAVFCLWVLPRLAAWFFTSVGQTRTHRFVFCLAGMAAGATVSLLGGIEGLVGAFLAGIGLNRHVPARSGLMEHIEFFGAALFVPAFLISVGLSIDPRALFLMSTVEMAAVFLGVVLVTKTAAAFISGRIFGFSIAESGLMASLTIGQAAATLAVARVGVEVGMFSQQVLNAAVLTLVVAVPITSLGTRAFARRIELSDTAGDRLGGHVLVEASTDPHTRGLTQIAIAIARGDGGIITPFVIVPAQDPSDQEPPELAQAVDEAHKLGSDTEGTKRVAGSRLSGMVELGLETEATFLLLPWEGPRLPPERGGSTETDAIGAASPIPVAAARLTADSWDKVVAVTGRSRGWPARAEDANLALEVARRLSSYLDLPLVVLCPDGLVQSDEDSEAEVLSYRPGTGEVLEEIRPTNLVVIPTHVVSEASLLGAHRITRAATTTSLVVVGGPGRLRTAMGWAPDGLAGIIGPPRRNGTLG